MHSNIEKVRKRRRKSLGCDDREGNKNETH